MDLKEFDKLRKKINIKDFEGSNKGLNKWLYIFSYIGNISAMFFAYFLVYPSLLKAITLNLITGSWGITIAFIFTIIFLSIFEITKRYFIRNFSSDYFLRDKNISKEMFGWLLLSITIIVLSFYLSIAGSKNLATTSLIKNVIADSEISTQVDSLSIIYDKKKKIYESDNEVLRKINNDLRNTLAQTPVSYISIRREYQISIDKNIEIVNNNQININKLNDELIRKIEELKENLIDEKSENKTEDNKNILLFIIIVIFNELIIIGGVYFREFYEHNLFKINQQKFEKIYKKKDRYLALLAYIYQEGKLSPGNKVISEVELKSIVADKTNIENSNKVVKEFLQDMDRLDIFNIIGKRRFIATEYQNAINIINHFDDTLRILENME